MPRRLVILALALLTACAARDYNYQTYLAERNLDTPAIERFPHCRGYGCRHTDYLSFTARDWAAIGAHFANVDSAAAERAAIGPAIGTFEQIAGFYNGTGGERAGTYLKLGDRQHDCIDESTNTTVYLALLQENGWLRFHDVAAPRGRLPILGRGLGPHQTAVIADRQTGDHYAVDSWFHDNGRPAEVVAFDDWFLGWRPE